MPERTYGIHLGPEGADLSSGFVVEEQFLSVYEISKKANENSQISQKIRDFLAQNPFLAVSDFENGCQKLVQEHSFTSFAAVYLKNNQLWTYVENGVVLLRRENELFQSSQEKRALNGEYLAGDLFFLVSQSLKSEINTPLSSLDCSQLTPKELVEKLSEKLPKEPGGILIIKTTKSQPLASEPIAAIPPQRKVRSNLFQNRYLRLGILLAFLVLVLLQSFFFIRNTLEKRRQEELVQTITQLTQEYRQLEKDFPRNPTQTTEKMQQLRQEVTKLKEKYPKSDKIIDPLAQKLQKSTVTLGNPKVKAAKLFYDPGLIDKKLKITYLKMTEEFLAVVDQQNKRGYLINVGSKNHDDFSLAKLKQPTLATEYDQELYVYSEREGIFESENGTLKKVITYEKDWGTVADLEVFNGNIYLLSTTGDEIYKFTPIEGGYGAKSSYFQSGQSLDLENVKSLAIDFSVYLLGDSLYKYTAGARDGFNLNNQLDFAQMTKVFKTPKNAYLYLLDSTNSRVVVLNENGRVTESLFNSKLKNSPYFGVFEDEKIIFVHQNKLYELDNQ
jgi:hypothetical protein